MTPINFPEACQSLARPSNMTDEQCGPLPTARGLFDGFPCMVSQWQPTDEERAAIAAGAPIVLHVLGTVMPPVCVATRIECDGPTVGTN